MAMRKEKETNAGDGIAEQQVDHHGTNIDRTDGAWVIHRRSGSGMSCSDIYHMQIMEGDVIHRTIQDNHTYIAHYHTGGAEAVKEIDETQELYPYHYAGNRRNRVQGVCGAGVYCRSAHR